jgi:enoyl-[acyl-carrier protein] reductase II
MLWLANAELAASVSNAGALGVISPYAEMVEGDDPQSNLRLQIRQTRRLTDRPFGINIPINLPMSGLLIDVLLQESAEIVITAAGSPEPFTELLHSAGICVLHVISTVSQAKFCDACGVDVLIAEGAEAGGRIGRNEVPLLSLLPQVVNAVSLPVIAAGGIVDGKGMAAALALGADGIQLGTRFLATRECLAHPDYKRAIVKAQDADTIVTRRGLIPTRSLKSRFPMELAAMEKAHASEEDIQRFIGHGRARKAQIEGDMSNGDAYSGSSVGLIKEVLPAALVVEKLIKDYEEAIRRMQYFTLGRGTDA